MGVQIICRPGVMKGNTRRKWCPTLLARASCRSVAIGVEAIARPIQNHQSGKRKCRAVELSSRDDRLQAGAISLPVSLERDLLKVQRMVRNAGRYPRILGRMPAASSLSI